MKIFVGKSFEFHEEVPAKPIDGFLTFLIVGGAIVFFVLLL